MASIAKEFVLPQVLKSKTTLQYARPRNALKPFYNNRFKVPIEKREETLNESWIKQTDPLMPEYPYGPDRRYPEANFGLYGGQTIRTGNKISDGRNKGKTKRTWYPNAKLESLQSVALDRTLVLPVTARVKRTIKKCGGLDQYLLGSKPTRIRELGMMGWKLRWHVMNTDTIRTALASERAELRLGKNPLEQSFAEIWADDKTRIELVEKQTEKWTALKDKDERFQRHHLQNLIADTSTTTSVKPNKTLETHTPATLQLPLRIREAPAVSAGLAPPKKDREPSPQLTQPETSSSSTPGDGDLEGALVSAEDKVKQETVVS